MKIKIFTSVLFFIGATYASAVTIEALVARSQKNALPEFPTEDTKEFRALQEAAQKGTGVDQEKLTSMLMSHIGKVYTPLEKNGGILFSVRRPVNGYDEASKNYAVNLESFFAETTDRIKIEKRDFMVTATNGTVWHVGYLEYKPSDASIEVSKDGKTSWIALADLKTNDKRFVENACADEVFKSSGEFEISSADSRSGDETLGQKDKVSHVNAETGEKVVGSFVATAAKGISRKIVLENKGSFPLGNLVVEYQSFVEQTIMKLPKDFPSDYRCVGYLKVPALAPGEKKELVLNLPETVTAKQTTVQSGDYEFYRVIPADLNQQSEGRMNGVWVKVHRFTPYGERLIREYKSSGVPDVEWANVAPVGADIR